MCANRIQSTIPLSNRVTDALPIFADLHSCNSAEFDCILHLLSHFTLFQNIPSTSASFKYGLKDLLPYLNYQIYPAGSAIYHEGAYNTKLYILLRGIVHTFIPKSFHEIQDKPTGDTAGVILATQKLISLKRLSLLNSAGPRVLGKLMEELNNKRAEMILNTGKGKIEHITRLSSYGEGDSMGKKIIVRPVNRRQSMAPPGFRAELEEPKEVKQLEKLSNMLFSLLKSNANINPNPDTPVQPTKGNNVSAPGTNLLQSNLNPGPVQEDLDELDILEELRRVVNESIAENTAKTLRKFTPKAHKYFVDGQCVFKQFDEYECGAYLGSIAEDAHPTDHSAVALNDVHVLICEKEHFLRCFQDTMFERERRTLLFNRCLGHIVEPLELNYFMQHFMKCSFAMNETIFSEGTHADKLYLISKGEIKLRKDTQNLNLKEKNQATSILQNKHAPLHMVSLGPQQFFGEEALQEEGAVRLYTAVATGRQNEIYYIDIEEINLLRETCEKTLEYLSGQYTRKNDLRGQRVHTVAQANHLVETEGELPFHEYRALRNFDKYLKHTAKIKKSTLLSQNEGIGEQIAYELSQTDKRKNGIQKLMKMQGIELPSILKDHRKSKDNTLELSHSQRQGLSLVASRRDSLNGTLQYQSVGEDNRNQSSTYEGDTERKRTVKKEENTLARVEEYMEEYKAQLKLRSKPGYLDSSIINPEVTEVNADKSKVMLRDLTEKMKKFYTQRTYRDDLDERREKRAKDLYRSNSVISRKESSVDYGSTALRRETTQLRNTVEDREEVAQTVQTQREMRRNESMESLLGGKRRVVHKEKLGIARNMLLYNEISSLVVQRDLNEKYRIKAVKKGKGSGSVSARQGVDEKEERLKSSLVKMKRIFAKREKKEEKGRYEKGKFDEKLLMSVRSITAMNE